MKPKEIAILIIFVVFTLPFLLKLLSWTFVSTTNPSSESIEKGGELIAEAAVPWWIGVIEWLSSLQGIGAILIVGFIFFLRWIGEIKGK